MSQTKKRFFFFSFLFLFIFLMAILVIRLAQGYRPDLTTFSFRPNGLLVATSTPEGAQLFLDGKLISATNTTLNLTPGDYDVEIKKDGFTTWKKTLPIKKELVALAEAYLFPTFPNLQSLTFTGAANPVISPDGQKVVFSVTDSSLTKNGLWVLDLTDRPLGFGRDPRQIVKSAPGGRDFGQSRYVWSPDSKQILVNLTIPSGRQTVPVTEENLLLEAGELNPETNLLEVSLDLPLIYDRWEEEIELRRKAKISKLPEKLLTALEEATEKIVFSPDETKFLYTATASATIPAAIIPPLPAANPTAESRDLEPDKIYVYDLKEDKNFLIMDASTAEKTEAKTEKPEEITFADFELLSPSLTPELSWFPTSRHLFYVQEGKITILEYDSLNWVDVYTGPFENSFAFPFPAGNKILILTSLGSDNPPNLYAVSLR